MEDILFLLIDNDQKTNAVNAEKIKSSGIGRNVKITVNSGHAFLYLNEMNEKLSFSRLVILMNMETPIMNGFEFLEAYNVNKALNKNNILIIAFNERLTQEKIQKSRYLGISNFIASDLRIEELQSLVSQHFNSNADAPRRSFKGNSSKGLKVA
jgi:response regulator RpfG family c-di-GMP phosphodiesterase